MGTIFLREMIEDNNQLDLGQQVLDKQTLHCLNAYLPLKNNVDLEAWSVFKLTVWILNFLFAEIGQKLS